MSTPVYSSEACRQRSKNTGSLLPRSRRDQNTKSVITFVPSGEHDASWSSASTPAQSTSPLCLNPSCYPAALTTRHCGDLRYSSLQPEHTARQRNKREREGHRHRFGCMPDHFAPAFDREKVHPSGARTSASLRLYSSARALPPASRAELRSTIPVSTLWDLVFCTVALCTTLPATQDTGAVGNDV